MMVCNQLHKFIDDYVYDEVSFFVKAQIDEHIASCPKCREEVEFLRTVRTTLRSMPKIMVDDTFKAGIHEKLDAMAVPEVQKTKKKEKRSFLRDWRTYSALAACLVLAVAVQSRIGDFYEKSADPGQTVPGNVANLDVSGMQQTQMQGTEPVQAEPAEAALETGEDAAFAGDETVDLTTEQTPQIPSTSKRAAQNPTIYSETAPRVAPPAQTAEPIVAEPVQNSDGEAVFRNVEETPEVPTPRYTTDPTEDISDDQGLEETDATGSETIDDEGILPDEGDGINKRPTGSRPVVSGKNESADLASAGGTISVNVEDVSKARDIASRYGTVRGNAVEMTKDKLGSYLRTLDMNEIEYSQDIPNSDIVIVDIVAN